MEKKIVLMYHDVYADSPDESGFNSRGANTYKITAYRFEEHLKVVKQICPNIIFTFDDGGVSFYTVIAPLLEKYGFVGLFFIATDYIDTEGFLKSEQIKALAQRGHVIGAHSASHPENMTNLSIEERKGEWFKSIKKLSSIIGKEVSVVSIPNGYYKREDLAVLKSVGVKKVYTSSIFDNKQNGNLTIIGRVTIHGDISTFKFRELIERRRAYWVLVIRQIIITVIKKILGDNYLLFKRWLRRFV